MAFRKSAWLLLSLFLAFSACDSPAGVTDSESPSPQVQQTAPSDPAPDAEETIDYSEYPVKYYPPKNSPPEDLIIPEDDSPFLISGFGPVDVLPAEITFPSIYVAFSQPVVPLSMLGKPASTSSILEISPPLGGVFRWYGTSLLSFDSSDEALPQRLYTVSVSPSVQSLGGKELTGQRRYSFRTEPLSLEKAIPGDNVYFDPDEVPPNAAASITLIFNHEINPEVTSSYIDISVNGSIADFTYARDFPSGLELSPDEKRRAMVVRLEEKVPEEAEVEVLLKEGARSEPDYIGTQEDHTIRFRTITDFTFEEYETDSWAFPRSPEGNSYPVYLTFSHPVDEDSLPGHIRSEPPVEITADSVAVWGHQIMVANLPFPPESSYRLFLDEDISDIYGRNIGIPVEIEVEVPEARRYAYFPNTGSRMLEAEFPHRIAFEYQNVFDGVWKIGRILDPYAAFDASELTPYDFTGVEKNIRRFEVLELDPWLNEEGLGSVGISWNFSEANNLGEKPTWAQDNLQLQVTDLGITTRVGYNRIIVLVSSLSTGKPVTDADVFLMRDRDAKQSISTDESGMAIFELENGEYNLYFQDLDETWRDHLRIRVSRGLDTIDFVPNSSHNTYQSGVYSTSSPLYVQRPRMEVFLFTDRGLYRPGEKVSFRGIDLDLYLGEYESYRGSYTAELKDSGYNGRTLKTITGFTSEAGGFFGSFSLPSDLNPGYYVITYTRDDGRSHQIYFQIANFENLTFQVDIESPERDYYFGDTLEFDIEAEYLAGGKLAGGEYRFFWSKEPAAYRPPGTEWEELGFGPLAGDQRYSLSMYEGNLNSDGRASSSQKSTAEGIPGKPYTYRLEARVEDAGRREIAAKKTALVHPAAYYIGAGLSSAVEGSWSSFVSKGEDVVVTWNMVRPDGRLETNFPEGARLNASLHRVDWKVVQQQGVAGNVTTRYEMVEELEQTQEQVLSRSGGSVTIRPKKGGLYRVRLSTIDANDRYAETGLEFYATGSDWIRWGGGGSTEIGLEPDKEIYQPGETATILLKSPLPSGNYLVSIEREKIFEQYLIELEGSSQVIGIPVNDNYIPVVYVSVSSYSVRSGTPEHTYFTPDLDKPKGYYGVTPLYIDTAARRIDLEIKTDGIVYRPGGDAEIIVEALQNGKPVVGAEITFLAVDRGVVDLIDYHVPDPLPFFYSESKFPLGVNGADSRSLLIDPVTYEVRDLYGGDAGDGKEEGGSRSNFVPTAVFEPFLITDENGIARVRFSLPDNLTTYRCTAIAADNGRFGYTEAELQVQQPINVTSLLPDRMRVRDTLSAGVMITNMDRSKQEVAVAVNTSVVEIYGDAKKTVTINPGQTVELTFDFFAEVEGYGEVVFSIQSSILNEDLVAVMLVEKPLVSETVTTTGRTIQSETGNTATEGVVLPGFDSVQSGNIELTLSATLAAGLKGAMEYLIEYPHGCFEQRASKLMPLVVFSDFVTGLDNDIENVERTIRWELEYWATSQREDGGFPFWPESSYRSSFYVSLRIAHIIKLAETRGYQIPLGIDQRKLVAFLASPDEYIKGSDYLMAYSLYVQSLYGVPVHRQVTEMSAESEDLGIPALGFIGLTYHELRLPEKAEEILEYVTRFIKPGTRSIDLTSPNGAATSSFYGNEIEELSLLLMLQIAVSPDGFLTDRIAETILQRQYGGIWRNTSETNWALLSLSNLAEVRDEIEPNFVATAVIGEQELFRETYDQPAIMRNRVYEFSSEPLATLPRDVTLPLLFSAEGNGALYYTASLTYELPAETAGARDEGFSVYSAIEELDGTPVKGNILKLGETYRQRVVLSTSRRRSYAALRVPVPSGVEILDTSFATTGEYDNDEAGAETYSYFDRPHEMIFQNEVRYYFDRMVPGSAEIVFHFRTTSRGVFPTPPAVAECMYEPEIFGRSRGGLFIIRE